MTISFDKRWGLLLISLVSGLLLALKLAPVKIVPTVRAVISQQRVNIKSINQTRNIAHTKTFDLDAVAFPEGSTLVHRRLGPLGFSTDFFIDIHCRFTTAKPLLIEWIVESDDGFRLSIDDSVVSEFLGDRPFGSSIKRIEIAAGTHNLTLSYFQGFGNLGLRGSYRVGDSEPVLIGQSERGVVFEQFPANSAK